MNSTLVKEKIGAQEKSRLYSLLNANPPKSNSEIIEELFLGAMARFPTKAESAFGMRLLTEHHDQGAEDLLWVLLNKPEFVLNY
jgi:hypothetical protein